MENRLFVDNNVNKISAFDKEQNFGLADKLWANVLKTFFSSSLMLWQNKLEQTL
jgi:hypothetical protein